jgi:GH35 family endo-1,4-beta-xylanase
VLIRLVDRQGKPAAGRRIRVEQTRHSFLFGCGAFDAVPVANPGTADGNTRAFLQERMEKWRKLFNYGTLPFYWGRFEPEKGRPRTEELRNAARWLRDRNVTVKGHPLCWHTGTAPWLLELSDEEILEAQLERIEREVTAFRGLVDLWDVVNEVVIMPVFDKYDNGIIRICKRLGRVELVKSMFGRARECNPRATLLLNDFNVSTNYEILIEGCLAAGVKIDAIGIQSHQHQGFWGTEKLREVLERFEHFGLPIHFTENTFVSGALMPPEIADLNDFQVSDWPSTPEGEERQRRDVAELYTTLFEHPLVEAITTWDFHDGAWLGAPGGLVRKDNSEKPAYEWLDQKINRDWRTETEAVTDSDGNVQLTGFLGGYRILAGEETGELWLGRDTRRAEVAVS